MAESFSGVSRRAFLTGLAGAGISALAWPRVGFSATAPLLTKPIPKTGERLPVIGMGSWITMNVGSDTYLRRQRTQVVNTFFERGGGMIDSSPMCGSSEEVIGHTLSQLDQPKGLFSATKVWTQTRFMGERQITNSFDLWGIQKFDLFQIHNLVDWETHLQTLLALKAQGRIRYIGITTSHGRKHRHFAEIMRTQPIDFVQFTYNVRDREAEDELLLLAAERKLAVIINRPFQRGGLFDAYGGKPLPAGAAEIGCQNWAQFFLKFVVSHPAVTCAIPATSRVDHMIENMGAGQGPMPDAAMRTRMADYVESLLILNDLAVVNSIVKHMILGNEGA